MAQEKSDEIEALIRESVAEATIMVGSGLVGDQRADAMDVARTACRLLVGALSGVNQERDG